MLQALPLIICLHSLALQRIGQAPHEPPQSTPVSVPSRIPLVQEVSHVAAVV